MPTTTVRESAKVVELWDAWSYKFKILFIFSVNTGNQSWDAWTKVQVHNHYTTRQQVVYFTSVASCFTTVWDSFFSYIHFFTYIFIFQFYQRCTFFKWTRCVKQLLPCKTSSLIFFKHF